MSEDKRLNEVIRVKKIQSNFVVMDKGFIENADLSWKAKGILAYLLSKPDNWKVVVKDIMNHAKEGKSAVYSGLNELKKAGYYVKRPIRDEKGAFVSWESIVFESPMIAHLEDDKTEETRLESASHPLPDFPEMDNPDMENPFMENRERNNNYLSNNDLTKNYVSQVRQVNGGVPDENQSEVIMTDRTRTDKTVHHESNNTSERDNASAIKPTPPAPLPGNTSKAHVRAAPAACEVDDTALR